MRYRTAQCRDYQNESKKNRRFLNKGFWDSKTKNCRFGINSHTGDNGVIGKEDDALLRPSLKALFEEGYLVYGPYAADSFSGSSLSTVF